MEQILDNKKNFSILVVDDTTENLRYLNDLLKLHGYDVRATPNPEHALSVATNINPDLILLDIKMPKIDGYTLAKKLRELGNFDETPIIFISALDDINDKIKAFEAGGVDYITKPFEEKEVLARVGVHLQLHESKQHIESLLKQQDYFIKKIMHEINTPVSVITLNTQILEVEHGKNTHIDTIKASAKILSSIYDELSYLIKKELHMYDTEWIKLIEFISTRIAYFHEVAEIKSIELHFEVEKEFSIHINPIHLERLIDNILSNAIKYSNHNTQIELLIGKNNYGYFLSIQDEGVGIEDVNIIFEQYYQSSQDNIGLGIGLATIKEICETYNITIQIHSEKNKGSIFTCIFPDSLVKLL